MSSPNEEAWLLSFAQRVCDVQDNKSEDMRRYAMECAREFLISHPEALRENPQTCAEEEMECWDGE